MNYQESREYIDKITREIPSVLGLDHMRELMKRLGNPQDDLKYVHIAGTNGKGSVIALLRCFHMCPWDYSNTPLNYRGLIRPDYAPLWFGAGLFFEKILGKLS